MELLKNGIDVTVICLDPLSPRQEVCDDSELWKPLEEITLRIATPTNKSFFYSRLMGIRYGTITYARWVRAVIKKARVLNQEKPFDLIYSRSLPMEAHIAGYWVARNLRVPWLVNINDPWDWHLFPDHIKKALPYFYCRFSNFWMCKTFSYASLVTYPSTRLRDYHYRISGLEHKSDVIPHIGYNHRQQDKTSEFRIVHAGKLGGSEARSSRGLLEGIKLFLSRQPEAEQSFRLILVGPEDKKTSSAVSELGLQRIVNPTGRVSYERSLEHISSATVCALVESLLPEGIFLPSKLADYVAARKPVLALSPKVGVIADMVGCRGITHVEPDNAQAIRDAIGAYYSAFKQGSIESCRPSEDLVRQFAPETVGRQFIERAQMLVHSDPLKGGGNNG